jgi:hypothetical protein
VAPDDEPPDAFDDEVTSLDALGPIPVSDASGSVPISERSDSVPISEASGPEHIGDSARPIAVRERNTKTYSHSAEFLAGREAGYKQGIDAAILALRDELVKAGCTKDEIAHIVACIRAGTDVSR